jgi:hypothetical protein
MIRIDISYLYVHLTWSLWFFIYLMVSMYGIYAIWTDLREDGGPKENWIMFGLVLTWIVLALTVYKITESV